MYDNAKERVIKNPSDDFFKEILKPYYVVTKDGQYLFACMQKGRRPDRAFYMVPDGYKLGKGQKKFNKQIGKKLYEVIDDYIKKAKIIVQEGVQGENGYEVGIKITTSIENPHSAYIAWMGKLMIFPPKGIKISCFNTIIPERLPEEYVVKIKKFWSDFDPDEPLTLYDFTEMERDVRRVLNLRIDYFGGAFKKPNLTMVWNKAEEEGLISYHAGCSDGRILKGLSGTGKTTLTVGKDIEQDDALVGLPIYENEKVKKVKLIGLEAASFAKSEGLNEKSPEWKGLMSSKKGAIVLALNIDCEGVEYVNKKIKGHDVIVPYARKNVGSLECTKYEKSGTTNGRFIFQFRELNKNWGSKKYLKAEGLSFRRYDVLEPILRVTDARMAVAFDSACESIITSAVAGRKAGERVRSYAATDFMAREQSQQAILKLKVYNDLDLSLEGKLIFFVANTGYVGEYDINGLPINGGGHGEKITIEDTKKLLYLMENKKIKNWIEHPAFGYLLPEPKELEKHGLHNFRKRFNLLRFYTADEIAKFYERDAEERTKFLEDLFKGQEGENELKEVINVWKKKIPSSSQIKKFFELHYME